MEFKFERKTFNINERLRIGIISDSQLSPVRRKNETTFRNNLVLSLSVLKKQGCNMIIFAGDIGNMAIHIKPRLRVFSAKKFRLFKA